MKFSFFKTDSEYRQMDYFPEGTITEIIPNKNNRPIPKTSQKILFKNVFIKWHTLYSIGF